MIRVIRLTPAQISAIQLSGLFECQDDETAEESVLRLSVQRVGTELAVSANTQDSIISALTELANSEDALAEHSTGPARYFAQRAATTLGLLARKTRGLTFSDE